MINVLNKVSSFLTNVILSNIKLSEGILLLQLKAAQEGRKSISEHLQKTPKEN